MVKVHRGGKNRTTASGLSRFYEIQASRSFLETGGKKKGDKEKKIR